jgi:hypothetical protein
MSTVKEYRRKGFQARRVSFALKVIAGLWTIAMIGIFVTSPTLIGFLAMIAGSVSFIIPSLLIAAVFDDRAERQFNLAAAHRQVALLGVVQPRK